MASKMPTNSNNHKQIDDPRPAVWIACWFRDRGRIWSRSSKNSDSDQPVAYPWVVWVAAVDTCARLGGCVFPWLWCAAPVVVESLTARAVSPVGTNGPTTRQPLSPPRESPPSPKIQPAMTKLLTLTSASTSTSTSTSTSAATMILTPGHSQRRHPLRWQRSRRGCRPLRCRPLFSRLLLPSRRPLSRDLARRPLPLATARPLSCPRFRLRPCLLWALVGLCPRRPMRRHQGRSTQVETGLRPRPRT